MVHDSIWLPQDFFGKSDIHSTQDPENPINLIQNQF